MTGIVLDAGWLRDHPLPAHEGETDKNSRGRVLAVGGAALVPGALRLTGEAALRAGAGKLRMATIATAAPLLGIHVPEAAVMALPTDGDGEIATDAVAALVEASVACDALVFGPGMGDRARAATLIEHVLAAPRAGLNIVLDAAVCACAGPFAEILRRHDGRIVLTPHHGEMAALTGCDAAAIAADPEQAARAAAAHFGAVVVLKASRTVIAPPGNDPLIYAGGGVGLATGGSGDVLAGIVAGLLARGAAPLEAAAWGVWIHGEAGRRLSERIGPMGFLARELLPEIPSLLRGV